MHTQPGRPRGLEQRNQGSLPVCTSVQLLDSLQLFPQPCLHMAPGWGPQARRPPPSGTPPQPAEAGHRVRWGRLGRGRAAHRTLSARVQEGQTHRGTKGGDGMGGGGQGPLSTPKVRQLVRPGPMMGGLGKVGEVASLSPLWKQFSLKINSFAARYTELPAPPGCVGAGGRSRDTGLGRRPGKSWGEGGSKRGAQRCQGRGTIRASH